MPTLDLNPPRESALICWPVLWDEPNDGPAPVVEGIHVTAFYWPAYGEDDRPPAKQDLLDAFKAWDNIYRGYTTINVEGPAAFGVDNNYPVLRLDKGVWDSGVMHERRAIHTVLYQNNFDNYDKRFDYNPHVSVDLRVLLEPPQSIVIGPPELWYKDDEPVKI